MGDVTAQKDKEENLSEYIPRAQPEQASGDGIDHHHLAPAGRVQTVLGKGANYSIEKKKDGVVSLVRYVII